MTMPTVRQTVEQTRRLVESDEVFAIFSSVGMPKSLVQKYLNVKKVPQLFVLSGRQFSCAEISLEHEPSGQLQCRGRYSSQVYSEYSTTRKSACSIKMTTSGKICCEV